MINQFDLIKNITKFTAFLLILAGIAGTASNFYRNYFSCNVSWNH